MTINLTIRAPARFLVMFADPAGRDRAPNARDSQRVRHGDRDPSEAPPRTAEVGGWVGWLTCAWAVAVLGFSGHAGLRGCVMTKRPVTTTDVLDGHVSLDLECL